MILLDTNVLSELVKPRPHPAVVNWTRHSAAALAIPTIAVAEMAFGIEKLVEGRRRDNDRLFDFNVKAAWAYGRILATARKGGRPMSISDAAIAAIAAANDCALATRNVKDFATAGLQIINPWHAGT